MDRRHQKDGEGKTTSNDIIAGDGEGKTKTEKGGVDKNRILTMECYATP